MSYMSKLPSGSWQMLHGKGSFPVQKRLRLCVHHRLARAGRTHCSISSSIQTRQSEPTLSCSSALASQCFSLRECI